MHWAEQYIGRPWVSGARGPMAFDCWGLTAWVLHHHFGIDLPSFPGVPADDTLAVKRAMWHEEHGKAGKWAAWGRVDTPSHGCAVLMGGLEAFSHSGVYIELPEGGIVLHCVQGCGVIAQTVPEVLRAGNFQRITFFKNANLRTLHKPLQSA